MLTDSGILPLLLPPPATTATDHSGSWRLAVFGTAWVVVAVIVGAALHLGRQRGGGAWNSIWAEDGSVFLTDAYRDVTGTFFAQNGGYVHVVPRIIAGVVRVFAVDQAAAAFAIAGSLVVAVVAVLVYVASREVLHSRMPRLVLAGAVTLLPVAGDELYANAVNLHFYLVYGCFWALVWQSEKWGAVSSRSAAALAATLSDPAAALLLPLAVVAPAVRRTRASLLVSGVFCAGLVVQAILMRGGESPQRNWEFHLEQLPDIFALRVAGGLLVGDRFLDDLWLSLGRGFSYSALLALAVGVTYLLVRSSRATAAFALIALGYAGLFFCVHLVGRGTGGMDPDSGSFHLNGARYVLLPFLLTLTALLALLDDARGGARLRWARAAAIVWLVAVVAVNYPLGPNARSTGPRWDDEVTKARGLCLRDSDLRTARILVAPSPPRVWFARISCSQLGGAPE